MRRDELEKLDLSSTLLYFLEEYKEIWKLQFILRHYIFLQVLSYHTTASNKEVEKFMVSQVVLRRRTLCKRLITCKGQFYLSIQLLLNVFKFKPLFCQVISTVE